ncbi:MAG: hypothetical protein ACH37Z_14985 [Anaerolineae bacterium]
MSWPTRDEIYGEDEGLSGGGGGSGFEGLFVIPIVLGVLCAAVSLPFLPFVLVRQAIQNRSLSLRDAVEQSYELGCEAWPAVLAVAFVFWKLSWKIPLAAFGAVAILALGWRIGRSIRSSTEGEPERKRVSPEEVQELRLARKRARAARR